MSVLFVTPTLKQNKHQLCHLSVAAENLTDFFGGEVKIYKEKILAALMIDVVVDVFGHTDCNEAIVKRAV